MIKIVITQYSHNFSVKVNDENLRGLIHQFHRWFDEYEIVEMNGSYEKNFKQSFSYPQADVQEVKWRDLENVYRFHINALSYLQNLLVKNHVLDSEIEHIIEPIYEPAKIELDIKSSFKPFPEQVPILEQLKEPTPVSKMLPLFTGGGKSVITLITIKYWGYRAVGFMKPGYIDKWVGDIHKALNIEDHLIVTIRGSIELKAFIRDIDEGRIEPSIVLISNATFRVWISDQEKMPPGEYVPGYPCYPWEFMQYCGFGFRFIDEVHQDYHANFRFDLMTHVEQSLSLSATLITRSDYLKKMYKLAYPDSAWIAIHEFRKYANGLSWHYEFMYPEKIQLSARGRKSYSHVEVEKSIMRSSLLTKQYYAMVHEVMKKSYLVNREPGHRCLVYFATKQMCQDAVFYFKQVLPGFIINKFNQGDPLKNITESDICFATIGKAGAAIDIPNLTVVIRTVALDSIQGLLQTTGRLRDIRRLYQIDRDPLYIWFVCDDFEKHRRYNLSNMDVLKDKLVNINRTRYGTALGFK